MYLALKAHFQTEDYDVVKMQGRIRASRKNFDGLGKEFAFRRLVKVYKEEEVCNLMVANFVKGNHWGGVFDVEAAKEYTNWKRRQESLGYVFEQELLKLQEEAKEHGITDIFKHDTGNHPFILKAFLRNSIGPETLVILNRLTGFADGIDLPVNDPVWSDVRRLIVKYRPFVKFNREKFSNTYNAILGT